MTIAIGLAGLLGVAALSAAAPPKPTCAVLTFDARGGVSKDDAALLTDRFSIEMDKLGLYTLTPREKQAEVLREQKFARSDNCSATDCAIEAGRLLGAQFMIYGSVGRVGETYTVNAYLVNVETGAGVKTAGEDFPGKIDEVLKYGMAVVAAKLTGVASSSAGAGSPTVGGAGLDALLAQVKVKEVEAARLAREQAEANRRLAEELAKRKAQFEKEYETYRRVVGSAQADDATKRIAWKQICQAWGVKGAGDAPGSLVWDDRTGLLRAVEGAPGQELALDLGGGVKMEFVWIEALKGWVGKYEVTNEEYRKFKPGHNSGEFQKHSLNGDRQPVVEVSYDDATAFCEWVNRTCAGQIPAGCTARLPDGKEWLTFAQCGDGRKYPWSNEWPPKCGNYADQTARTEFSNWTVIDGYRDGYAVSCPVESSGKNDWGLYGVGGNVWEWTSELYDSTHNWRVLRGASWDYYGPGTLECASRVYVDSPAVRNRTVGFRLVVLR
jgi:formylglycine-generating enzyme required for sulfatase activity/TolB-like protein